MKLHRQKQTETVAGLSLSRSRPWKRTSLWAVDPDSSHSVLRWSGSLSARGKSSPSHIQIDDLNILENVNRNFEGVAEPPNTMILVVAFEDSTNYLQLLVQIMYVAPTTVHQCSASKLEMFALHERMRNKQLPEPVVDSESQAQ